MRILFRGLIGFLFVSTTCSTVAAFKNKKRPEPVTIPTTLTAKEAAKEAARDFWERSLPGKMVAPPDATSPSIEKLEGKLISVKRKRRKQLEKATIKPAAAAPVVKPVKEKKVKPAKVPKVKPAKVPKVKPAKVPKVKPVKVPKVKPVKVPKVKRERRRRKSSAYSPARVLKAGAKGSVFAAGATASSLSLMPLLTEGYSRAQAYTIDFDKIVFPQVTSGVTEICIVFHGAEGCSENIEKLMRQLQKKNRVVQKKKKKKRRSRNDNDSDDMNDAPAAFLLDWSHYSSKHEHLHPALQASFCAERIGKEVAKRLPYRMTKLHVIGVGVGAAAANACVVQLKKTSKSHHLYIQETLLNPNCARGLLDIDYGLREFGKKADYAQQFVASDNHDQICTKCAILDVATIKSTDNEDWALEYYNAHVQGLGFVADMKKFRRGVVHDAAAAAE